MIKKFLGFTEKIDTGIKYLKFVNILIDTLEFFNKRVKEEFGEKIKENEENTSNG